MTIIRRIEDWLSMRRDEISSKKSLSLNVNESMRIETSLAKTEKIGSGFGGWALSKSSIRYFCEEIFNNNVAPIIVELGGGQSTIFWDILQGNGSSLVVTTFEHDPHWGRLLKEQVDKGNVRVELRGLKKISDIEKKLLFESPEDAMKTWDSIGKKVPETEYQNTRLANAFYSLLPEDLLEVRPIDGLIVDGPHGSGRSIAFPLFYPRMQEGTILLIDDYNHYDFLGDLSELFQFTILKESDTRYKSYVIIRIDTRK